MRAEILTVGDELLRGEIADTNSAHLARRLLELDIETRFFSTVADVADDLSDALRRAIARSDVVLVSGGLGPTRDDITIEVLAETFDRKLLLDAGCLEELRAFFRRFGREMAEINAKQAYFPEGAEVLPNPIGTAPGTLLEVEQTPIFCMPGVPRELARMMDEQVLPRLRARVEGGIAVRAALLRTFGIGESSLDELLRGVELPPGVELGFRTSFPDNLVRIRVRTGDPGEAQARLERTRAAVRDRLGALCYSENDAESLAGVTGALLGERGVSVAAAESCTGGWIGERLSAVPGASRYFRGAVVAYSNEAKQALLGVAPSTLGEFGAVSAPVARAMAEGARHRLAADLAIATTGISGPGGGGADKPVGLVFVALAHAAGSEARRLVFPLERERHRQLTGHVAIDWLRRHLLGEPFDSPRVGTERP